MAQDKKYQIFISSTYEDLKEARSKVMDSILSMYHIPIGMEMFSAADDDQWEIIKSTIDTSDYYVVIIGFRYGSTTPEGISYTEKEYDYAVSKGIPVLAFVRDRNISISNAERDDNQEMVKAFINKAQGKMRNTWTTPDDLAKNVSISLHKEFERKPRVGWVRASSITSQEENLALEEKLNALQDSLQSYQSTKDQLVRATSLIDNLLKEKEEFEKNALTRESIIKNLIRDTDKLKEDLKNSRNDSMLFMERNKKYLATLKMLESGLYDLQQRLNDSVKQI